MSGLYRMGWRGREAVNRAGIYKVGLSLPPVPSHSSHSSRSPPAIPSSPPPTTPLHQSAPYSTTARSKMSTSNTTFSGPTPALLATLPRSMSMFSASSVSSTSSVYSRTADDLIDRLAAQDVSV